MLLWADTWLPVSSSHHEGYLRHYGSACLPVTSALALAGQKQDNIALWVETVQQQWTLLVFWACKVVYFVTR
jgi:hypothetical protein